MKYENDYLEKNREWHRTDAAYKAEWVSPYLKGEKIAEIGCGSGEMLKVLSAMYPDKNFTGYEISKTAFRLFLTEETSNLRYRNIDFFKDKKKYDQILIVDLIEHLEDPFLFLKQLKPQAHAFLFHIPLEFNAIYLIFNKHINTYHQYGHLHFFEKNFILRILKASGYCIDAWQYTPIAFIKDKKNYKTRLLGLIRGVFFKMNQELTVKILGGYSLLCSCH